MTPTFRTSGVSQPHRLDTRQPAKDRSNPHARLDRMVEAPVYTWGELVRGVLAIGLVLIVVVTLFALIIPAAPDANGRASAQVLDCAKQGCPQGERVG